jgi:hypothetical protein
MSSSERGMPAPAFVLECDCDRRGRELVPQAASAGLGRIRPLAEATNEWHPSDPLAVYLYGMRFAVVLVCAWGRPLPRRDVVNQAPQRGDLRVEYLHDPQRLRYLRVARLIDVTSPLKDLLPMLYEVKLVAMNPCAFTLSGFERLDGAEYAQSWLVTSVAT